MKLEHVAINVSDPVAVAAWYEEHLGMKIVMAQTTGTLMHFLADDGGSMIELYNNPDAPRLHQRRHRPVQSALRLCHRRHRGRPGAPDRSRGHTGRRDN